jgi:hypothetical protein
MPASDTPSSSPHNVAAVRRKSSGVNSSSPNISQMPGARVTLIPFTSFLVPRRAPGAARAFLKEAMIELLLALDDDPDRLMRARANLRIACAYAAEGSSSIVQMLTTETGASAIFESSGLERAGRDINAVVKHVAMSPQSYILAGRLHLGLDPGGMRF